MEERNILYKIKAKVIKNHYDHMMPEEKIFYSMGTKLSNICELIEKEYSNENRKYEIVLVEKIAKDNEKAIFL